MGTATGLKAPSVVGLDLLNGHSVDIDALLEGNNVVVFALLNA